MIDVVYQIPSNVAADIGGEMSRVVGILAAFEGREIPDWAADHIKEAAIKARKLLRESESVVVYG